MSEPLVVIGNGMAAARFADELSKRALGRYAIAVVGGALLWTLEKGLGEAWTPDVAAAWTTAYGVLSGYMISEAYGSAQATE